MNPLFPTSADNRYQGSQIAAWVFLILASMGAVRSCIHLLAPDGGAGSIAGMDLSVAGASGIIFAFSLWGSSQLLYATTQLVVFFRYKTLIPFMCLLMVAESLLRILVGRMKPVGFSHTPPGAVANWVLPIIALLMLFLSMRKTKSAAITAGKDK